MKALHTDCKDCCSLITHGWYPIVHGCLRTWTTDCTGNFLHHMTWWKVCFRLLFKSYFIHNVSSCGSHTHSGYTPSRFKKHIKRSIHVYFECIQVFFSKHVHWKRFKYSLHPSTAEVKCAHNFFLFLNQNICYGYCKFGNFREGLIFPKLRKFHENKIVTNWRNRSVIYYYR